MDYDKKETEEINDCLARTLSTIAIFVGKDKADKLLKLIEENSEDMSLLLQYYYYAAKVTTFTTEEKETE